MSDKGMASPSGGLSSLRDGADKSAPPKASIPDADVLCRDIRLALAENPDWLPDVFAAVTVGAQAALNTLNKQRAESDAAFLAALALCDTKRMSPDLKASLTATITRPMYGSNLCELEKKFARLAMSEAQAIEARQGGDAKQAPSQDESVVRKDAPKGGQQ